MKPIIKWLGGKRRLLPELQKFINKETLGNNTYYEPFIGAGALLFSLAPDKCVLNDLNEELINTYQVIRDNPEDLINKLHEYKSFKILIIHYEPLIDLLAGMKLIQFQKQLDLST